MMGRGGTNPPRFNTFWIYIPLLAFLGYMWFWGAKGGDPIKTEWYKVKEQMVPAGDVDKITFVTNQNRAEVTIKKSWGKETGFGSCTEKKLKIGL